MSNSSQNSKHPFLAGLFGLIPGLGHFYAGNAGKGIILFGLLLLFLCLCSPMSMIFPSAPFAGSQWSIYSTASADMAFEYSGSHFVFHTAGSWLPFLVCAGGVICVVMCVNKKMAAVLLGLLVAYLIFQTVDIRSVYFAPYEEVRLAANSFPYFYVSITQFFFLFLLFPILLLYSIADAAVTAVQYNRFMQFGGAPPTPPRHHDHQPKQQNTYDGTSDQDALRRGARARGLPV